MLKICKKCIVRVCKDIERELYIMNNDFSDAILLCPVCKDKLIKDACNKIYKCNNNHTYDIAKEGYVNLLISNQKRSKNPGDSKEMVLSRVEFLSMDYYKPISDKINEMIVECLGKDNIDKFNIMDLGCGEGYYLTNLKNYMNKNNRYANIFIHFLDIFK